MIAETIRDEIVSGLRDILADHLNRIILYGSVARGEAGAESDVDIALIVTQRLEDEEKNRFLQWNAELDLKYNRVFSIVDIEKDVMEQWADVVPFYRSINKEGVVLWKAA